MTNFERIKNMSVEEMAEFLGKKPYCTLYKSDCIYGWHGSDCTQHEKNGLKERQKNEQIY